MNEICHTSVYELSLFGCAALKLLGYGVWSGFLTNHSIELEYW